MKDDFLYPPDMNRLGEVQAIAQTKSSRTRRRMNELRLTITSEFDEQSRRFSDFDEQSQRFIAVRGEHNAKWGGQRYPLGNAVEELMDSDEMISTLERLLRSMEPIFAQPELDVVLAGQSFQTDTELVKLEAIRSQASAMTSIHVRMQRHLVLSFSEYVVVLNSHEKSEQWKDLNRSFYRPLAKARDAFFEEPTRPMLNLYLATADALLGLEHPLAKELDGVYVKRDAWAAGQATELYAELVCDELVFELLDSKR